MARSTRLPPMSVQHSASSGGAALQAEGHAWVSHGDGLIHPECQAVMAGTLFCMGTQPSSRRATEATFCLTTTALVRDQQCVTSQDECVECHCKLQVCPIYKQLSCSAVDAWERPTRGTPGAQVAEKLAAHGFVPELIVSSDSTRTRQTLDVMAEADVDG